MRSYFLDIEFLHNWCYFFQTTETGSPGMGKNRSWTSSMETHHGYLATCWSHSFACKYVELGIYWDSPRTTIRIQYVKFLTFTCIYFSSFQLLKLGWLEIPCSLAVCWLQSCSSGGNTILAFGFRWKHIIFSFHTKQHLCWCIWCFVWASWCNVIRTSDKLDYIYR